MNPAMHNVITSIEGVLVTRQESNNLHKNPAATLGDAMFYMGVEEGFWEEASYSAACLLPHDGRKASEWS